MNRKTNIVIGHQYNNFTVLSKSEKVSKQNHTYYNCQCVCGVQREVRADNLGKVKGCGCQRKQYVTTGIRKPYTKKAKPKKEVKPEKEIITPVVAQEPKPSAPLHQKTAVKRERPARVRLEEKLEELALNRANSYFEGDLYA